MGGCIIDAKEGVKYELRKAHLNFPEVFDEEDDHREHLFNKGMNPDFPWGTNHTRVARAIRHNVNEAIRTVPREHLVFFTFTFDHLPGHPDTWFKHANACFRKASKRFLDRHFAHWYRVLDVHGNGRPHFHGIAITRKPILEGFDAEAYDAFLQAAKWDEWKEGSRSMTIPELRERRLAVSSNPNLREMWRDFDEHLPVLGFGPVFGIYPIRNFPDIRPRNEGDEGEGTISSKVGSYLVRAYYRAVPAIKKAGVRVRAYQPSRRFPSRKRASDMKSKWWLNSLDLLMKSLGFTSADRFKDLIGREWGLALRNVIDALDTNVKGWNGEISWREIEPGPWLAIPLRFMIRHDRLLNSQSGPLLPLLDEICQRHVPRTGDPRLVGWIPFDPLPCACCPDNPANQAAAA